MTGCNLITCLPSTACITHALMDRYAL